MAVSDIQGHRGARGLRPENSMAAFEFALQCGADTLEMDVVISADNQVVVSHDPFMSDVICSWPDGRPVGADEAPSLLLYGMSYEQIRQFDCGQRRHPGFPGQQAAPAVKPLLADVFSRMEELARGMGRSLPYYNIETKSTEDGDGSAHPGPELFAELLLGEIASQGVGARTTVQSFDPRTLRHIKTTGADVELSLLVGSDTEGDIHSHVEDLGFVPEIYSPEHVLVSEALMRSAQNLSVRILPWTVNTVEEMERLVDLGVTGLITDYPDVAVKRFRSGRPASGTTPQERADPPHQKH